MAWRSSGMPETMVYFVKLFWMAAIAASLICCGVGKCGSPAPKSTSFAPCARSFAASAVTAMVAEISIRPMRSEKTAAAVVVMLLSLQISRAAAADF